jgi:hypothetical protein
MTRRVLSPHDTRRCEFDFRRTNSSIGSYCDLIDRLPIQFSQAEIHDFCVATLRNENIRRLNVAVHRSPLVCGIQTIGDP